MPSTLAPVPSTRTWLLPANQIASPLLEWDEYAGVATDDAAEKYPVGDKCKKCHCLFKDNFDGLTNWAEFCSGVHDGGVWSKRYKNVQSSDAKASQSAIPLVAKSRRAGAFITIEHTLDIETPVVLKKAAQVRKLLKLQSTQRIPNLHIPIVRGMIELDGDDSDMYMFKKDESEDKVGVLRTSLRLGESVTL